MLAQDVLAAGARRRHGHVVLLAVSLVLVLVAAAGAVLALREADSREDARARERLAAAAFTVTAVGVATDHRVAVVLSLRSTLATTLVGATVSGDGWRATHDRSVSLVRDVSCEGPPPPPVAAEATVELHGQRRQVDLLADPSVFDVVARTGREACGDVEARRALALKASRAVRGGNRLRIVLALANRSLHPVVVRALSIGRLHVETSARLPLTLAPHQALRMVLLVDARRCGTAAPVISLAVAGQGGGAVVTVASADLPQLGLALRQQLHCR